MVDSKEKASMYGEMFSTETSPCKQKQLQILGLTPQSWLVRKAAEVFKVSKSTIQQAKLLKAEKGLLNIQIPKLDKNWAKKF